MTVFAGDVLIPALFPLEITIPGSSPSVSSPSLLSNHPESKGEKKKE